MSDLYLIHHGIKGQKWGVRRFQNEDGSLTKAGKDRYSSPYRAASTDPSKWDIYSSRDVRDYNFTSSDKKELAKVVDAHNKNIAIKRKIDKLAKSMSDDVWDDIVELDSKIQNRIYSTVDKCRDIELYANGGGGDISSYQLRTSKGVDVHISIKDNGHVSVKLSDDRDEN